MAAAAAERPAEPDPWDRAVWTCRAPAARREVLVARHRPGRGTSGDWRDGALSGWRVDFGGDPGARTLPDGLPLPDDWRALGGHALVGIEHVSGGSNPLNWGAIHWGQEGDPGAPVDNPRVLLSSRGRETAIELGPGARMGIALRIDGRTLRGASRVLAEGFVGIDAAGLLAALREPFDAVAATATLGVIPLGDGEPGAGMRAEDWIARIGERTPLEARAAADLGAAQDGHGGRRDAAYVFPADEAGLANDVANGTRDHSIVGMAVVIAVTNARGDRGAEALDEMEAARAGVRAALVGWTPPGAFAPVAFRRGRMLRLERDARWWQDEYECAVIREGANHG